MSRLDARSIGDHRENQGLLRTLARPRELEVIQPRFPPRWAPRSEPPLNRSPLTDDLRRALDRGDLFAAFQPQVDVATREIVAVEALCRWIHPELGLLMPYAFIPVAEDSGLIDELGQFMMEEACSTAAAWRDLGHRIDVSVNLSPEQLDEARVFDAIIARVVDLELPPYSITVEVTEASPILDLPNAVSQLGRLRAHEIGVSIDDFGIGHSSLDRLDQLPATELKIDKSLVQDESADATARMYEVIAKSHARGMRVVAEGIETERQFERMRDLGCDRVQGFLFAKSVSRRELERQLSKKPV